MNPLVRRSLPAYVSSSTLICEARAVSLMSPRKKTNVGGRMTRHAWGRTTWRRVAAVVRFMLAAASHWFRWTDSMPARTISAR